jgi:hypothetical protein
MPRLSVQHELETMIRGVDRCDSTELARRKQQARIAVECANAYLKTIEEDIPRELTDEFLSTR